MNRTMKKTLVFIFLLTASLFGYSQTPTGTITVGKDKPISTPFFSATVGYTFPFGEMGNRYKPFLNLNANLGWKTKSNWLWNLEFAFQFGSDNLKIKDEILSNMLTHSSNPFIISQAGTDAGLVAYNRNLSLTVSCGKVIPLWFSNPNSGLVVSLGLGFIQHQIIYQTTLENAPQIQNDYAYGYDRQMRGPMLTTFVGYIHMSKNSFANFFIGVQMDNAWTKMTREYQFDLKGGDDKLYHDGMFTLKVGWMFPFFGRDADKIYF